MEELGEEKEEGMYQGRSEEGGVPYPHSTLRKARTEALWGKNKSS